MPGCDLQAGAAIGQFGRDAGSAPRPLDSLWESLTASRSAASRASITLAYQAVATCRRSREVDQSELPWVDLRRRALRAGPQSPLHRKLTEYNPTECQTYYRGSLLRQCDG